MRRVIFLFLVLLSPFAGSADHFFRRSLPSPASASDRTLPASALTGPCWSADVGTTWDRIGQGLRQSEVEAVARDPLMIETLPVIAVDPSGHVHIAYMGTYAREGAPDGVTTDVFYTNNKTGSFSNPVKIEVSEGYYSKSISLAVDRDGYAHIAFRRSNDQIFTDVNDFIAYATNRSGTFASAVQVTTWRTFLMPDNPSIGVDRQGAAHIAFEKNFGIYYTNNASGSFATPQLLAGEAFPLPAGKPDLAVDNSGKIHIAFSASSSYEPDVYYLNNVGGSFATPMNVSNVGDVFFGPKLAIDGAGVAHIAFMRWDISKSIDGIYYIENRGGKFDQAISVGVGGHSNISVAVDQAGAAHVAVFSLCMIRYVSNSRGAFGPPVQVGESWFDPTTMPAECIHAGARWMAVGPDTRAHFVFYDFPEGDIYYLAVPTAALNSGVPTSTPSPIPTPTPTPTLLPIPTPTPTLTPTRTPTPTPTVGPTPTWTPTPVPVRGGTALPSSFYGTAKVDGANAAEGTAVTAWIGGVQVAVTNTSTSQGNTVYRLVILSDDPNTPDREGGMEADTIVFKIGDYEAQERATWRSGTNVELNLNAASALSPGVALASIANQLNLVYFYDPSDPAIWKLYDPRAPAFVNTLERFERGKGYWIKVSGATTLTYGGTTYRLAPGWNLVGWLG